MTPHEAELYKADLIFQIGSERVTFFGHKLADQKPSSQPHYDAKISELTNLMLEIDGLPAEEVVERFMEE
jgi:hypothetical protein